MDDRGPDRGGLPPDDVMRALREIAAAADGPPRLPGGHSVRSLRRAASHLLHPSVSDSVTAEDMAVAREVLRRLGPVR